MSEEIEIYEDAFGGVMLGGFIAGMFLGLGVMMVLLGLKEGMTFGLTMGGVCVVGMFVMAFVTQRWGKKEFVEHLEEQGYEIVWVEKEVDGI